jgi:hypothetical protein
MSVRRTNFTFIISHPDLGDVTVPISSLTARIREGTPSYLQVVVPGYTDYSDDILSRTNHCRNCELVINRIQDGDFDNPTEILRVDFENYRLDRGGRSQSMFIIGHRTFYNPSRQTVTLLDGDYIRSGLDRETGETTRIRFTAYQNVSAGDTVTYTLDSEVYSFEVELLTLNASQYDFEQEASSG